MSAAAAVAIGAIAGVGYMLFGSKPASAKTTPGLLERMTAALATNDPAQLRALAAALRSEGYTAQAGDLEAAAKRLEVKPAASSSAPSSVLKRGSKGPDVTAWQTFLVKQGYTTVVVDGEFGVQTEDATRQFQRSRGLLADGVVGPDTLRASTTPSPAAAVKAAPAPALPPTPTKPAAPVVATAAAVLKRGSTGDDVKVWQAFLVGQGYSVVTVDGVFGAQTEDSTKGFQRAHALLADGVVGPETKALAAKTPPKVAVPAPAPAAKPAATTPAAVPTVPIASIARVLSSGMSGADVAGWQSFLRVAWGQTSLAIDGTYGPATVAATMAFQKEKKLTQDGKVGPKTLAAAIAHVLPAAAAKPAAVPAPAAAAKPAAAPAPAATVPTAPRALKRGLSGDDVKAWQTFLRSQGSAYSVVTADGQFGAQTEESTKGWQRSKGLAVDGVVGPETLRAALSGAAGPAPVTNAPTITVTPGKWRTMRRGTSGSDVREWQTVLQREGYSLTPDGIYGPDTETKTKLWQVTRNIAADGVVGPAVVAALRARAPVTVKVGLLEGAFNFAPDSPLPGLVADAVPMADSAPPPDRALASELAMHLERSPAGTEDRSLVARFQRLKGLNATGAYGATTAVRLMDYGIVPPDPFYWPSHGVQRAKANYRAQLRQRAARDGARASEWLAAERRVQ